jgi:hypothetical protein
MSQEASTTKGEKKSMHIVDLSNLESDSILSSTTEELWAEVYEDMSEKETLWVFVGNEGHKNSLHLPMQVASSVRKNSGLILKNIITRYTESEVRDGLDNVYEQILFFVKNKREYIFDKDSIRVEHVYEGVEWGDRETGQSAYHDTEVRRYNPDGKDPGNVWLDEIRNQTSDETVDQILPFERNRAIRRCVRAGSMEDEKVQIWGMGKGEENIKKTVEDEDRVVNFQKYD